MDRYLGRAAAAVLAIALLTAGTAQAQVIISQVYGGGGNSGATLRSDFIELRNNGASAVSLDGWSVQYASATGTSWQRTALGGAIAAGGYYLVKQANGAGGSVDLPAPDAVGTIAMAATAGKVALVNAGAALVGACPQAETVVADFVGFGAANCAETTPVPTLSNTTAALRNGDGSVDTGNNSTDFSRGAPNPRNSGSAPPAPPQPPVALSIAQIQGNGPVSAYDKSNVVTEGIVTARKFNNGFFLQAVNDDGDPATSDGIFVFTGSAPQASAAVGNRVRVTGTVAEFVPSSNPNQLSITQVVSPTVELLATGAALPAAIELGVADLGPGALPGTLERFEGMRVSAAQAVVVAPSGGFIQETVATSSSDGVFHVVLAEVARPFREPGIGVLDATLATLPAGKNPPRFDTNPERLMVRSRGQIDTAAISVDSGAQIAGLLGVLDYFAGTWALLPDTGTPPVVSGGRLPQAVNDPDHDAVTIASFNLLRLFDEIADGNGAPTLTPEALDKRLGKTAIAICDYLKAPDILGVVEVENLRVLGLLAERINSGCARAPAYVPYLQQGNDVGGINVGYLVSTRAVGGGAARVEVVNVTQIGKDATLANPNGSTSVLNDRPPLLLRARVHQDQGASYPVTVIVNHLRSLIGIDDVGSGSSGWTTGGARVRAKRGAQAAYLAALVESLQQNDPAANLVLVGDFNAFEFNDGYVDVLGVIKGEEAAPDQVLTYIDSPLTTPLIDGSRLIADPAERYSYVFAGNAQTLDHVLVNETLFAAAAAVRVEHARINADFGVDNFGDAQVPLGTSDHDPVRLSVRVPAFRRADLSVTASATPMTARVGQTVTFSSTVANAGPGAAEFAAVAFVFDALLSPSITHATGWTCATPVQDATTTTLTCTTPSFAANASAAFAFQAIVPNRPSGQSLRMAVAMQSQVPDPANGNNQAAVEVVITPSADLSVKLSGEAIASGQGARAQFLVPVTNAGPDAANGARLVIQGNARAATASIATPQGWACDGVSNSDAGFRVQCRREQAMAPGTESFNASIVLPGLPASGVPLTVTATVGADTPDPSLDNNSAAFTRAAKDKDR